MKKIDPAKPFDALPDLPPPVAVETRDVLKKIIQTRNALLQLNLMAAELPNPDVLLNTLPVLEAQGSSAIENVITTADELFRYHCEKPIENERETKEAHNYCSALKFGCERLASGRPVCSNLACELVSILRGTDLPIRSGTIALRNSTSGETQYTPPASQEIILQKLANWENFLNQDENFDPLTKIAIGHYQFEAIHPFSDGNGRVGRILNLLLLVQYGQLTWPILYLSRYILRHRAEYYQSLRAVTFENRWEEWILFLLEAIHETADWTTQKIEQILELMAETLTSIQKKFGTTHERELLEVLFSQPYCRIRNFVEANIAKRQTATKYIRELQNLKILEEANSRGAEKLFVNSRFLDLLSR